MPRKNPLDIEKERQSELAAIWGSDVRRGSGSSAVRVPAWRGGSKSSMSGAGAGDGGLGDDAPDDADDAVSNISSLVSSNQDKGMRKKKKNAKKQDDKTGKRKATSGTNNNEDRSSHKKSFYRLHCFIEVGTHINDVREVFERYEPKVEIKTSQKGNLLNKVQYAVLKFPNKAMALHAVKTLDGSNQRDLLGVNPLKLAIMLSREQNKILRRRTRKDNERAMKEKKRQEMEQDEQMLKQLVQTIRANNNNRRVDKPQKQVI
jgi:hypothetical protein